MKKVVKHLKKNWIGYGFETLAVLIGVLTAFALNNWNENRKAQIKYESYIKQLKLDIDAAIQNAENVAEFADEQSIRTQSIIDYLLNPNSNIDFESFRTAHNMAGRYGVIVLNVGNLGELLSGDLSNISNNRALVVKVHELQNIIETESEVAERMTRRLEEYQRNLIEFESRRYLRNYPQQDSDLQDYDTTYFSQSSQYMETISGLTLSYNVYSDFATRISRDLKDFKGYIEKL
jgi:hypothetical protein